MAQAMRGVTKAMMVMNKRMNLPQMQRIMMEFEKQSEVMEMKEEMMSDTMDDAFEEEGEEEAVCWFHFFMFANFRYCSCSNSFCRLTKSFLKCWTKSESTCHHSLWTHLQQLQQAKPRQARRWKLKKWTCNPVWII